MLSGTILQTIMSALGWILKKVGQHTGYAILGGATIIDYIARLLYTGVLISVEVNFMVAQLMALILRFAGRTVVEGASMTAAFFQWVLDLLFRLISTMAARAIGRLY